MNYLAHLLLADDNDASRVGNLLGDFTRGPISELEKQFPSEVVRGIRMHRAVDRYTDDHPLFKQAKQLLAPERRRFAGIIVDVFFDHFLCLHWQNFSTTSLKDFIADAYHALETHPEWHAGRLKEAFPYMKNEDWLARYMSVEGIGATLRRISKRSPRLGAIANGAEDLEKNYEAFDQIFSNFMPELIQFVRDWKKENPPLAT